MTSMSVKEAGMTIGKNMVSSAYSAGKTTQAGFEAVWNKQAAKNLQSSTSDSSARPKETEQPKAHAGNVEQPANEKADDIRDTSIKEETVSENQPLDENENLEEAMEVLGTAVQQLIQQVADTFQIPVEEVVSAMDELGMEPMDLLQTDSLSQLLLNIGQAEDTTHLLTNENLYQDYKTLMTQQQELLQNVQKTVEEVLNVPLDEGQMEELIARTGEAAASAQNVEEPEITVELSEDMEAVQDSTVGMLKENTQVTDLSHTDENAAGRESSEKGAKQPKTHGHMGEPGVSPALQQFKTDSLQMQTAGSVESASSAWDMDTRNIMRQIMDYMKIQLKPDMSSLEMQLHPASLGNLQIQIASKGGTLTAQFVAQNETVKAALESQMIQLKESFEEQGVKVEAIEVTVQTHEFERNLDQGRGRNQEMPEKKNRTRRVQLNGDLSMEELEDMEEDSRLVADMMIANGNSVDYTA